MVPAPTTRHQCVSQNIEYILIGSVRRTQCGQVRHAPVEVVLGVGRDREVVQSDILLVAAEGAEIIMRAEIVGCPRI